MKKIFFAILMMPMLASAKDFTFKYKLEMNTLEIKVKADSWEEALNKTAPQCYRHFMDLKSKFSVEYGLDVIDVCANPR